MFRLELRLEAPAGGLYLHREFRGDIREELQHGLGRWVIGSYAFVWSGMKPRHYKVVGEGLWVIGGMTLLISAWPQEALLRFGMELPGRNLRLRHGRVYVRSCSFVPLSAGQTLTFESPLVLCKAVESGDGTVRKLESESYEAAPARFSFLLWKNLLRRYRDLNGREPLDSRFFFAFQRFRRTDVHLPLGTVAGYDGACYLAGSQELINLALCTGLGDYNDYGCGMLVPSTLFTRPRVRTRGTAHAETP